MPNSTELPEPMGSVSPDKALITTPEKAPMPVSAPAQAIVPAVQGHALSPQAPQSASPPTSVAPISDSALIADDADLIEKEWVLKAKAIVAQTAHDPNLQTKEMGKVKAEYLKKRYNKSLKLDES